jgi:membrane fusion protein, multidrug efflux system
MAAALAIFYSPTMRQELHPACQGGAQAPSIQNKKRHQMKLEAPPLLLAAPIPTRRHWRKGAVALVLVVIAGAGWTVLQKSRASPAPPIAATAVKTPVYELSPGDVATVAAGELHVELPLSGALAPLNQATVKSKVSGVVLETTVQEGVNVAAGQVIARLDGADARARVAQQQAALDEANARLSMAVKNNANSAALLKQHYISQNSYDTTQNSVELAQAAVNAAKAQLDLARIALNDTVIRAPLSGVVSKRYVQAGDKLAPDLPAFSIVDLRQMNLEAQVPASDIPRVRVGQDAQFKVDGFDGRAFSGKVARISPTTEAGSRAMIVYISVNNPDGVLKGGMFAKGSITTDKAAAQALVPLSAVRRDNGRDVVYRVDNGKVVAQPVKLGLANQDEGTVQVTEGLAQGATVLATKLDGVKPGSSVKLAAMPAPAPKKG